jgi:transcriptional regulator with XRE-family HTH domain
VSFSDSRVLIPARLSRARLTLGWSITDLARESGISLATISSLENGSSIDPRMSTIQALCRALNVEPNYLTGFDADPNLPLPILRDSCRAVFHPDASRHFCGPCSPLTPRRIQCVDCEEIITLGKPHPAGDCIRNTWRKNRRNLSYLAQRHGLPITSLQAILEVA